MRESTNTYPRGVRVWLFCLLFLALTLPLAAQNAAGDATHDIIVTREQVTDRALDLKRKFKESDPQWREGRDRYRRAYAEFNAYIALTKAAIRKGKADDLINSAAYKRAAEQASSSAKAFIAYADSQTSRPARGVGFIVALFSQGITLFNAYKDGQAQQREREADAFEKDVKWLRWEDIK